MQMQLEEARNYMMIVSFPSFPMEIQPDILGKKP